jgi:pSer/pThr/pTyr-binding forkhead associated (FHA) protein
MDSIEEIEGVIQDIDDRMSERIVDHSGKERDRVTRLLVGTVEGQELRFPLFKDRLTIGRAEQNDIQIKASYVSRRHAVLATEGDATRIIDWGSKNGVFVNSKRITEHFLQTGDSVAIGTAYFRYEELPKRGA